MNDKTKIIHLSDLHIGYKNCGGKVAEIFNNIIKQENPAESIIIITGSVSIQMPTSSTGTIGFLPMVNSARRRSAG
ncbi:MAG: hypothetical protein ABIE84_00840 [bacterium]